MPHKKSPNLGGIVIGILHHVHHECDARLPRCVRDDPQRTSMLEGGGSPKIGPTRTGEGGCQAKVDVLYSYNIELKGEL